MKITKRLFRLLTALKEGFILW